MTDRRTRLWLILFLVQVASTWVYSAYGAWPVDPFLVTGPAENRVNIAFLGDGYTKSDMGLFRDHTNVMVHHMFNESEEPFVRYANYFNAYRIEVMSNEAGADDPSAGIERDTALDATYGCANIQRLICINQSQAWDWIDEALQPLGVEADMRIASVNSKQYGGSGGAVAVFAGGDLASPEIALHELGHSFSGLADEYGGPGPYLAGEPPEVNVTTNILGTKWSQWIGYDQPGIGLIGTYAGGRYHDSGIYRPSHDSKMRSLNRPFDAVSRERIIQDIYRHVDPLDGWTDNEVPLVDPSQLEVTPIDPALIEVQWWLGDTMLATGHSLDVASLALPTGDHAITAVARDPTDWVRVERDLLTQTVEWLVEITHVTLSADLNFDGSVDAADAALLFAAWGSAGDLPTDLTSDQIVDAADAGVLFGQWTGDSQVPEPTTTMSMLATFIIVWRMLARHQQTPHRHHCQSQSGGHSR